MSAGDGRFDRSACAFLPSLQTGAGLFPEIVKAECFDVLSNLLFTIRWGFVAYCINNSSLNTGTSLPTWNRKFSM